MRCVQINLNDHDDNLKNVSIEKDHYPPDFGWLVHSS